MIRNRFVLLLDLPLIGLAAAGAFAIRFDLRFIESQKEFIPYVLLALVVKPVVYHAFGLYRRVWRYAGLHELLTVFAAVSVAGAFMFVAVTAALLMRSEFQFSRMVVLADWLLSMAAAGGGRVCIRLLSEGAFHGRGAAGRRLLIVGAGDAGAMVAREVMRNPKHDVNVVGFLDDDSDKQSKRIHGVRVLGPLSALQTMLHRYAVQEVVIAMPSAPGSTLRNISEECRRAGVRSRTVPGVFELLDGEVRFNRVRQVEISDLLRRAPVQGTVDAASYVAGRTVLVTGAGGSIGHELSRQIATARPARLVLLGHGENSLFDTRVQLAEDFPNLDVDVALVDVRDGRRLDRLFRRHRPDVVIHAAAHKHVPLMEVHPEEAVTNNVTGTHNVVQASLEVDASRFILISTDKAVAPRSIMGASKRVAELIVQDAARRRNVAYGVVRFGNVLGSRGSVVPFFQRQIERGGPVTITDPEMKRFFMTIPEAVHLVLQAGGLVRGGELFVLDMGEPVRIVDLAREMIRLSSRPADNVQIVFTGTRPGEKIEEVLWEPDARVDDTAHPHVLRVSEPNGPSGAELSGLVERLVQAAATGDRLTIENEFAHVIGSYVPASV